jgi:peroxiredoxin
MVFENTFIILLRRLPCREFSTRRRLKMSEKSRFNVNTFFLVTLCFIAVAVAGLAAGSWFRDWRQSNVYAQKLEELRADSQCMLTVGDSFPEVILTDMDENQISTTSLFNGLSTIIFFLSPGCEPCSRAIEVWAEQAAGLPHDFQIIGICPGDHEHTREYARKTEIIFPLYSDTDHEFPATYGMDAFPSMAAVRGDGRIAFVQYIWSEDITLMDVYTLITRKEQELSSK